MKYDIKRYDISEDKSLKAWSSADEYLLKTFNGIEQKPNHLGIYNDRFGFLTCNLYLYTPTVVLTYKSQEKAINSNLQSNNIPVQRFVNPVSSLSNKMDFVLIKIPKSLGLFQLFLEHISHNSTNDITVICAFMTRHFSPKIIQIAEEYFEISEQSKALKKSRLLTLTKKKEVIKREMITKLTYNGDEYKQYLGVFSADHIDYATQFFIDHIEIQEKTHRILDLASGNGVIGNEIFKKFPNTEIHLMDDSLLAVSSAELNIQGKNIYHHLNNEMSGFESNSFDLIVTNPPFHFEYEINIHVAIELFKECLRCLKEDGNLQIVANKHLNYKVHLEPIFSKVLIIAENKKFILYKCIK